MATKSAAERTQKDILKALDQLGRKSVTEDGLLFQGSKFVLPAQFEGNPRGAVDYLKAWIAQQEAPYTFSRVFKYRPFDGANAFQETMRRVFGTTGVGANSGAFGKTPPEFITVATGPTSTTQVPWGRVEYSPLDATFVLEAFRDIEDGNLFRVVVEAPRKHQGRIVGFFDKVEEVLREHSIYKGQAITAAETPVFIDPYKVEPRRVIYTRDTVEQINANVWALLEYADEMRKRKLPLKRAVLFEGPYGTGKSLAGVLTAQKAIENGWTYIMVAPGDNLLDALKTARMYAPSVVWFEDIDTLGGTGKVDLSKLLDALDGVTSKGHEVLAGFTSNFPERIPKGVMRPGRIDSVIHIGKLDTESFERLVRVVVPEELLAPDVDFIEVGEAYAEFLPAFAVEAAERALRYSIARNRGIPDEVTTGDLVAAAKGLREQLKLMEDAKEGAGKTGLDEAFRLLAEQGTEQALGHTKVDYNDPQYDGRLVVENGKAKK